MKVNKSLQRAATVEYKIGTDAQPIKLIEVSDVVHDFKTLKDASYFLGLPDSVVGNYTRSKTKVIKSKRNGKTYLIKKFINK